MLLSRASKTQKHTHFSRLRVRLSSQLSSFQSTLSRSQRTPMSSVVSSVVSSRSNALKTKTPTVVKTTQHSKRGYSGMRSTDSERLSPAFRSELDVFVKKCMSGFDASHDFFHVLRVTNTALEIAVAEGNCDLRLVELCALLHDVSDHKYTASDSESLSKVLQMRRICAKHGCDEEYICKMEEMIASISFSKEKRIRDAAAVESSVSAKDDAKSDALSGGDALDAYLSLFDKWPELAAVQDSDRLDAIGSIGVARAFCFGGSRDRYLFNFTSADSLSEDRSAEENEWIQGGNAAKTTVGHFYDKLLLLKDMMKTETGKRMAQKRHDAMVAFLHNFHSEWNC